MVLQLVDQAAGVVAEPADGLVSFYRAAVTTNDGTGDAGPAVETIRESEPAGGFGVPLSSTAGEFGARLVQEPSGGVNNQAYLRSEFDSSDSEFEAVVGQNFAAVELAFGIGRDGHGANLLLFNDANDFVDLEVVELGTPGLYRISIATSGTFGFSSDVPIDRSSTNPEVRWVHASIIEDRVIVRLNNQVVIDSGAGQDLEGILPNTFSTIQYTSYVTGTDTYDILVANYAFAPDEVLEFWTFMQQTYGLGS